LVDTVSSWVGRILAELGDEYPEQQAELRRIQHYLFDCQSDIGNVTGRKKTWRTDDTGAKFLEAAIDRYDAELEPINKFILPGGSLAASDCHVARTLTRNAERQIVALANSETLNPEVVVFLNRLSDYFFTVARALNMMAGVSDEFL